MSDTEAIEPVHIPEGLDLGGAALWSAVMSEHALSPVQAVQLLEACRLKDRLDKMNALLVGDASTWATLVIDVTGTVYDVRVTSVISKANETANQLKQLLAALRLPDAATGKTPQRRGARGAYAPRGTPKAPTSLDRRRELARERKQAASE